MKKWLDKCLTNAQVETAADLDDPLNEGFNETRDAEIASLGLETKLRVADSPY